MTYVSFSYLDTTSHFKNTNIDIRTKSRVVAVKPGDVIIQRVGPFIPAHHWCLS
jgi:uncharacterized membrane protein YvbJ